MPRLSTSFYNREPYELARGLLGMRLVSRIDGAVTSGWIVEAEAYLSSADDACHAARGPTPRNQSMFKAAGHAYVYAIHAKWCFNVVAGEPGEGCAVLIRALHPGFGIDTMVRRRMSAKIADVSRGPSRLCQSLGIDRRSDGLELFHSDQLWIDDFQAQSYADSEIRITPRIGVTSAKELPLRFVVKGSQYASGPRRLR